MTLIRTLRIIKVLSQVHWLARRVLNSRQGRWRVKLFEVEFLLVLQMPIKDHHRGRSVSAK